MQGVSNGTVVLEKRNGQQIAVPLDRLSDDDRVWLAANAQGPSRTRPPVPPVFLPTSTRLQEVGASVDRQAKESRQKASVAARKFSAEEEKAIEAANATLEFVNATIQKIGTPSASPPTPGISNERVAGVATEMTLPDGTRKEIFVHAGNAKAMLAEAQMAVNQATRLARANAKRRAISSQRESNDRVAKLRTRLRKVESDLDKAIAEYASAAPALANREELAKQRVSELESLLDDIEMSEENDEPDDIKKIDEVKM